MTKDELLQLTDTDLAIADLPGGKKQHVRSVSVEDASSVHNLIGKGVSSLAAWVMISACDENGARLFTDADLPSIVKMPIRFAKPICEKALELNGLAKEEIAPVDGTSTPSSGRKKEPKVIDNRTLDDDSTLEATAVDEDKPAKND